MTPTALYSVALTHHPETISRAVSGLDASIRWTPGAPLAITYRLQGDISHLKLPAPRLPLRADRLWEHTCLEAFIAVKGSPVYYEFNFSPSGEWAVYGFQKYREGAPLADDGVNPEITAHGTANYFELDAVIRLDRLAAIRRDAVLRIGLSAVIEDIEDGRSYWALEHPPGKPDFHHRDAFVLELNIPGGQA